MAEHKSHCTCTTHMHTHTHTGGKCSCMYHKPWRLNWPLTPGRRGLDEGLATRPQGWMEGTDEKLREKLRESQETNGGKRLGRTRGVRPPKVLSSTALPPSPLLTSISFSLPHVSVFFSSPLFHSLRWRLPVAMATAEEETIPEERRRGCQRRRLRREDVLRCSG